MSDAAASVGGAVMPRASSWRANLALLTGSVLVTFAAVEIAARMMLPAPLPWLYPQVHYRADPDLIFAYAPNQRGFSADKEIVLNERGMRGRVVPYERTPGTLRLLFLGDSIGFGYGVRDDEVVSARVAALLDRAATSNEAINSSVSSYNMRQEMTFLERDGIRYKPDWVIVCVCWNDLADKSRVRVDEQGRLTDDLATVEPLSVRLSESRLGYEVRNFLKRSRAVYAALEGWRALTAWTPDPQTVFRSEVLEGRDTPRTTGGWNDIATLLHRLKDLGDREQFRSLLVAFPIPMAVAQPFAKSSYPDRLQELGAREGIPVLDLTPAFRASYHGHESLFIPYDGDHPNAAGHEIAAEEITRFLAADPQRIHG